MILAIVIVLLIDFGMLFAFWHNTMLRPFGLRLVWKVVSVHGKGHYESAVTSTANISVLPIFQLIYIIGVKLVPEYGPVLALESLEAAFDFTKSLRSIPYAREHRHFALLLCLAPYDSKVNPSILGIDSLAITSARAKRFWLEGRMPFQSYSTSGPVVCESPLGTIACDWVKPLVKVMNLTVGRKGGK
jgi:hypothetical protein